jgi:hypothetical protein
VVAARCAELGSVLDSLLDAVWRAEREWAFDDRLAGLPVRRVISGEVYAARRGAQWSWEHRG